jgi:hypothetical protein
MYQSLTQFPHRNHSNKSSPANAGNAVASAGPASPRPRGNARAAAPITVSCIIRGVMRRLYVYLPRHTQLSQCARLSQPANLEERLKMRLTVMVSAIGVLSEEGDGRKFPPLISNLSRKLTMGSGGSYTSRNDTGTASLGQALEAHQ